MYRNNFEKVRQLSCTEVCTKLFKSIFRNISITRALHRRKKGQILAEFWPLFKNATFEFSKYESFVKFIMPKHSSDGNFRPFRAFIDFLQMFKVEKFAS